MLWVLYDLDPKSKTCLSAAQYWRQHSRPLSTPASAFRVRLHRARVDPCYPRNERYSKAPTWKKCRPGTRLYRTCSHSLALREAQCEDLERECLQSWWFENRAKGACDHHLPVFRSGIQGSDHFPPVVRCGIYPPAKGCISSL